MIWRKRNFVQFIHNVSRGTIYIICLHTICYIAAVFIK